VRHPDPRSGSDVTPIANDRQRRVLNRRGLLLAAAALPLTLAGCSQSPAYTLRYALKIVIRTGDREYAGRSVMQVDWTDNGWLAGFDALAKFSPRVTAEAVIVDLGKAGLVFGLVTPPGGWGGFNASRPEQILRRYLPPDLVARATREAPAGQNAGLLLAGYQALEGEYPVPRIFWPTLVRFRDPRNRMTAEQVADARTLLGTAATQVRMTLQITKDPVTERIAKILPWVDALKNTLVVSQDGSFASRLTPDNFKLDAAAA
jgi:hypothetical protein